MEKAIWNGKEYYAGEVAKDFLLEKQIRNVSSRELCCPDSECPNPILRYCHGEKRRSYFAHNHNADCDYAKFDMQPSILKEFAYLLYDIFREKGYDVRIEEKVLAHHYAHLVLKNGDKSLIVELGQKSTSAKHIVELEEEYEAKELAWQWLVVDEIDKKQNEDEFYFVKRAALNKSQQNRVIVLDKASDRVAQYKMDTSQYKYKNSDVSIPGYPQIYMQIGNMQSLCFENGEITLSGFEENYQSWITQKRQAFESYKQKQETVQDKCKHKGKAKEQVISCTELRENQPVETVSGIDYKKIVEKFLKLSPMRRKEILSYAKKCSKLSDLTFLDITENTAIETQFEKIIKILPSLIKKSVLQKMESIYW